MLLWRPKFYQDRSYYPSNLLFAEFQWIRMSTCWVIVNLITHRPTCKPYDVTILTVVVVCSEPILSVMFRFFKRWHLWYQIRYQETVNGIHSCFSCTFIRENKNFHFVSTLTEAVEFHLKWTVRKYFKLIGTWTFSILDVSEEWCRYSNRLPKKYLSV